MRNQDALRMGCGIHAAAHDGTSAPGWLKHHQRRAVEWPKLLLVNEFGVRDVGFVCGICNKVVVSVPDQIQLMSDSGPAIFVCYACGA